MKTIQEKNKEQVLKNGIESLAFKQEDLNNYTHDEVQILYENGFISAAMKNIEYMKRGL